MPRNGGAPVLTAAFWRTRRAAAIAGILFGVLLLTAMSLARVALSQDGYESLQADENRRTMISVSLQLIPFAGIAFLWFIGVVREQLGDVEDRLFSTVFLGSGLLFLAMLFAGVVVTSSMVDMLEGPNNNPDVWAYGRDASERLVSGRAGCRTSATWSAFCCWSAQPARSGCRRSSPRECC